MTQRLGGENSGMKKIVLIGLYLVAASLSARTLSETERVQMAECFFHDAYEYMFEEEGASGLQVGEKSFGTYLGGTRGILYYGSLVSCAANLLSVESSEWGDVSPLQRLSDISVFMDEGDQINPDIIVWGENNLIPSPKSRVYGIPFSQIYSAIFSRGARLMFESYMSLQKEMNFEREQKLYLLSVYKYEQSALDYLEQHYAGHLSDYSVEGNSVLTPALAYGFWLRRGIARTDDETIHALTALLLRYDKEWLISVRKKYAGVRSK